MIIPYAYNLTLFDVLIGGLAKALSFDGDVGATLLIGVTMQGCTAAMSVTGTVNMIGPSVEGNKFKNKGTATVANGQTYVTVTHGLAFTPVASQITIEPTNNMGAANSWFIDTIGSTTFRLNVDADPGVTTATFGWSAQY